MSDLKTPQKAEAPPSYSGTSTEPLDEILEPPDYDEGRRASAATPLQTVDFKYHGSMMQRLSIMNGDTEIFDVRLRMRKPHMIFYEATKESAPPVEPERKNSGLFSSFRSHKRSSKDGKMAVAEVDFHSTTRRMDCRFRGRETSLTPGKWYKEHFSYTSAISGAVRHWKNVGGWRSLDMICIQEDTEVDPEVEAQKTGALNKKPIEGVIMARLRVDDWYKMKLGSLVMFDSSGRFVVENGADIVQSMSPAEIEELTILGTVLSYYKLIYLAHSMVPMAAGASLAAGAPAGPAGAAAIAG